MITEVLSGRLKFPSVEITTLYPHGSSVTPGLGNRLVFFFFSFFKGGSGGYFGHGVDPWDITHCFRSPEARTPRGHRRLQLKLRGKHQRVSGRRLHAGDWATFTELDLREGRGTAGLLIRGREQSHSTRREGRIDERARTLVASFVSALTPPSASLQPLPVCSEPFFFFLFYQTHLSSPQLLSQI